MVKQYSDKKFGNVQAETVIQKQFTVGLKIRTSEK